MTTTTSTARDVETILASRYWLTDAGWEAARALETEHHLAARDQDRSTRHG